MPRKIRIYKCELCRDEFESRSYPPPRSCTKKECRYIIKSQSAKERDYSDKWLIKKCLTCEKEFKTRISKETNYCSNDCNLRSEERKINLSKKYKGKTLKERGWSDKAIIEDKKIKIKRNLKMKGKNYEELYPEKEKRGVYLNKLKKASSGKNNPMSYESLMERLNIDSFKEARELMPATGRCGEKHPFFGKHHTIESKKKMMETFEKNPSKGNVCLGYFDNIYWQGSWELKFIIDSIEKGNKIKRFDLEPFEYIYEDKIHHYFPDFIINNKEIIEIKGADKNNGRTISKNKQFKNKHNKKYKIFYDVGQNKNPKTFYRLTKEKYEDRLNIVYNVYENK